MAQYKDYYQVLGVDRGATEAEIKKAYKKLARKYHPDVSKEKNAEEKFKEVGEAYDVLKDQEKRAAYDRLGTYQAGQEFQAPPNWDYTHGPWGGAGAQQGAFNEADFSDFFSELFGRGRAQQGAGAGFGGAGFGGFGGQPRAMNGQDYDAEIDITLEDAFNGAEKTLTFAASEYVDAQHVRRVEKTVRVRIPKGATEGQKLRVPGKGGGGFNGGRNGDLYLTIHLLPHRYFKVDGHDLYLDLPITPPEAALGARVEVPTMTGRVALKVRPGAESGQKLRLGGKGLPRPGGGEGDLYAIVQIVTPPHLTDEEKRLYEELGKLSHFNPRQRFEQE